MIKRGICILLALLMSVSICACTGKGNVQENATPQTQSVTGENQNDALEQAQNEQADTQQTTADKKGKKGKKKESATKADKSKSKQKGTSAQASSSTNKSSKKQSNTPKSTTKKQTPTKKQSTTKQAKKSGIDVSFTINCSAAVGEVDGVPGSGYFLSGAGVRVSAGANVYEALLKCCQAHGIAVVASNTMYGMYVSSIGGLAEKEVGRMSGWTYTVNGNYPPKACDKYTLSDGDSVNFIYKAG